MDQSEKNHIIVSVFFEYNKNQREISAAILNTDKRQILISEFTDEEHFSNFESLILQTNPNSNDEKFTLFIKYPELESEKEKIQEILASAGVDIVEKFKKDFKENGFENDMDKILKTKLSQHVIESNMTKGLIAFTSILYQLKLHEDQANFQKFSLSQYVLSQFMKLDLAAINALLIFPKLNEMNKTSQQGSFGTLLELLDRCKTQIGSRTLRRWLKQPLQDENEINTRLNMVEMFINLPSLYQYLQDDFFKRVADLDKLYAKFYKVHSKKAKHGANISDIVKVYQLIINIQNLVDKIQNDQYDQHPQYGEQVRSYILDPIVEVLEQVKPLESMIQKAVDLDKAKNNEYQVNPRFSESLTDIYKNINSTKKKITQLAEETSDDLGIAVKLVDATTHYFLFEAKKKEADDAFRKKNSKKYKTISVKKNNITFTSIDLQGECAELQSLEEEYQSESQEVVQRLLTVVATYYPAMEQSSSIISELDVFCTFANIAVNSNQYVKPKINSQIETIKLIDSKHACLDARESNCIANDCVMNKEDSRFHIITGPNMGGKSTYIRQVAICTLLAHIGCYVPAKSAEFPIIDAIISRVGASDMQLRGISTFMSEMLEAACMIKIATEKSLIIIDELGRGTSTSEGFGLAWAISEYIVKQIKCYCLFATHFHEMIKMEDQIQGVKNYHVTCLAKNNKLNFQYRVKEGYAERSYGLYVAELLDFPEQIMSDAAQKLAELENFAGETSSQNNENQQQGDGDIMIDENLDYNNIDIFQLSKNATKEQREKVIQIAQKYTIQLQKANQIQQQEIMEELKKQVVNVLSLNN